LKHGIIHDIHLTVEHVLHVEGIAFHVFQLDLSPR
jgi:hypothetical protein